ncbi:Uncharacterised protein [BD1-7 clade bacterium]|uniref:Mu-like prophage protein gp36 n=1 Tax=BD1-7 clade bacterium TaxID=2029982 RepID=A0A5S9Q2L4_9GAMM|nr:Uncharacterised protein [BD1-7 clade bacterium]CAA0111724.1 Uncharacterised protein [BD1-7 clade bacterium]
MPYASIDDITDRYRENELLVLFGDDGIDTSRVNRALADATAEIDSHLAMRYDLPLAIVPAVLVRICVEITVYRLSVDEAASDDRRQRYDDAVRQLKAIANGATSLGLAQADTDASAGGNDTVELISEPRAFSRRTMGRLL